jgi:Na+/H+-translocating membrane pyrophosphatase
MNVGGWIPVTLGILGLISAWIIFGLVKRYPEGEGKVVEISAAIHKGAMVFMRREYTILVGFVIVVAVLIAISDLGLNTMYAFLLGAFCSGSAGYIGMYAATKSNARTTTAAHTQGASEALTVAFCGGSIMGMTVAAMGLLGLGLLYLFLDLTHIRHMRFMASAWVRLPLLYSLVWVVASLQKARTSVPTWWARLKREYQKMILETPA